MKNNTVVLAILDGFGITSEKKGNAIYLAKTPNFQDIDNNYSGTLLQASGAEVGLTWGEMGNSEVGHLNIGSGLVVYQNLFRINSSIKDDSFFKIKAWEKTINHVEKNKSDIHLMGLLSNGGVHSHIDHLSAILEVINNSKFKGNVFIHVFTDGRDTSPQIAGKFIDILNDLIKKNKVGEIASIIGRYYAMDRNENWDRTKTAYECLVKGIGNKTDDVKKAIDNSYKEEINDEFIKPILVTNDKNSPKGLIRDNDAVIFFNFRPDRARQLTRAILSPKFKEFKREEVKNLLFVTLGDYGLDYPIETVFPSLKIINPLAKIISNSGKKQFHIAETEKYAHVTYFLNGGIEADFPGEDRVLIPSKEVKSFDKRPEMSAYEITEKTISELENKKYDFIVINFANADMVGHTGELKAGVKAVEVLDECIGKIKEAVLKQGGTLIITADHGNVEEMINLSTNKIDKEHSTNPVPFWIVNSKTKKKDSTGKSIQTTPGGILADVAPTILELMNIKKPAEMTGISLTNVISDNPILSEK